MQQSQPLLDDCARARTIVYTPYVGVTTRRLREDLHQLITRAEICIDTHLNPPPRPLTHPRPRSQRASRVELCIVDEAERLSTSALEHLRDHYDRGEHGLIFIGCPASKNASCATRSSTAASGSPTTTGRCPTTN
ncbi:ATP-binding protein [Rhodococcus pyridinivorans]|uniref:ATP-binding protein n=1 Tax=Rhodococcus pyridinivorans TaxID=103816 RepID=UPI0020161741|nr:ATP-binding protein [Rhodococcus pyridinivorans]